MGGAEAREVQRERELTGRAHGVAFAVGHDVGVAVDARRGAETRRQVHADRLPAGAEHLGAEGLVAEYRPRRRSGRSAPPRDRSRSR